MNTAAFKNKIVYIAGKITGDPNYKYKFNAVAAMIIDSGASRVLNPALLPDGWEYGEYIEHCILMLKRADTIALIPDWVDSPGAQAERAVAAIMGKVVVEL